MRDILVMTSHLSSYRQYVFGEKLSFAPFSFLPAPRKLMMTISPNSDLIATEGHKRVGGILHISSLLVL